GPIDCLSAEKLKMRIRLGRSEFQRVRATTSNKRRATGPTVPPRGISLAIGSGTRRRSQNRWIPRSQPGKILQIGLQLGALLPQRCSGVAGPDINRSATARIDYDPQSLSRVGKARIL